MPKISTISFDLTLRDLGAIESWLTNFAMLPLDDLPLVHDHSHLASLVRQPLAPVIFRVADDPRILCVWESVGSAAIVFTLWKRSLRFIDILLVDDSPANALPWADLLTATEATRISKEIRPLLVRCAARNGRNTMPEILGIIAYMPVMCDLHGIV